MLRSVHLTFNAYTTYVAASSVADTHRMTTTTLVHALRVNYIIIITELVQLYRTIINIRA